MKKYADKSSRLTFQCLEAAKEAQYEKGMDDLIDGKSITEILKDLHPGKVAGKLGGLFIEKIRERKLLSRFKGVVNLWSLLENSPSIDQQIRDVERLFRVQLDRQQIQRIKARLKSIENNLQAVNIPH